MTTVRPPDLVNVHLDPNTCDVMEGHQHAPADVEQLGNSIASLGQLHPALIIEYADGRRLIAAGRRRWLACKQLGITLTANVWTCHGEDINLELFAKAIRIAENIERVDPSAMDIAKQLLTIRVQRDYRNAKEVGEHIGMSESHVKKYLSLFAGSEALQAEAQRHSIPLVPLSELVRCEKALGIAATKKLTARLVLGELTGRDLRRMRAPKKPKIVKAPPRPPVSLRESGDAFLAACATAPEESLGYLEEMIAQLSQFVQPVEEVA